MPYSNEVSTGLAVTVRYDALSVIFAKNFRFNSSNRPILSSMAGDATNTALVLM